MADEQKPQEGTGQEPHGAPPETDWKAEARKWEARAKENKAKADAYDEAQEAAKSDLQKAQERIAQLEQEKDERAKKDEHAALVKKVMAEQKVDAKYASLLTTAKGLIILVLVTVEKRLIGTKVCMESGR